MHQLAGACPLWPPHVQCSHFQLLQLRSIPHPGSWILDPESCILPVSSMPQKDMPFVSVCICPNDKLHKRSRVRRAERGSQMPFQFLAKEPSQQRKSTWMRFKMLLNYFKTLHPNLWHPITIGATWVLAIICKCCKKLTMPLEITFFGCQLDKSSATKKKKIKNWFWFLFDAFPMAINKKTHFAARLVCHVMSIFPEYSLPGAGIRGPLGQRATRWGS